MFFSAAGFASAVLREIIAARTRRRQAILGGQFSREIAPEIWLDAPAKLRLLSAANQKGGIIHGKQFYPAGVRGTDYHAAGHANLSAAELKHRFQAPSDELREVHNALAKTVQGITDATYPETVSESMLTEDLAGKINGKAEQRDMTAVQKDVALHTQQISGLCSLHFGTYTGNGAESREIDLGFAPKAVLVLYQGYQSYSNGGMHYGGLSVVRKNAPAWNLQITDSA